MNHEILVEKLYRAGFRGTFHQWLSSYLEGRKQYVKYKGVNSQCLSIGCGVPQGSTTGPLLFLIYVNSILELKLQGPVFSFADDTAIVYSDDEIEDAKIKCEANLHKLSNWFIYHKISPNLNKTKSIQYSYKKNKEENGTTITWHLPSCRNKPCNCTEIEEASEIKYLGIIINSNLNWQTHFGYLQNKLRKINYLLYQLKKSVPPRVKLRVYQALYEPVLSYGIEC